MKAWLGLKKRLAQSNTKVFEQNYGKVSVQLEDRKNKLGEVAFEATSPMDADGIDFERRDELKITITNNKKECLFEGTFTQLLNKLS